MVINIIIIIGIMIIIFYYTVRVNKKETQI